MDNEFPFGEEDAFSRQKLLQFIQNAVAVGQWEIAKACCKVFANEYPREKDQLISFLLDVFVNPKKMCCGSDTIPSPTHLSWLALQLLTELYGKEAENLLPPNARTELDFEMFLLSLKPDVNQKFLEECLSCYRTGLKKQTSNFKSNQEEGHHKMSKELQYFISEFAVSDLRSCRMLTDFLVSPEQREDVVRDRKNDLANSYMRILLTYLGRLKLFEEGIQTMLLGECLYILTAAKVYFDPDSRIFCETIISLVRTIMETNPSSLKLLYSCLIDQDSLPFLKLAMETSWSIKLKQLGLTGNASMEDTEGQNVKIANLLSESLDSRDSDTLLRSFQICNYYKVHMLECIIDASLYLIQEGDNNAALKLLKPSLLRPLKPLILLLAWPKCSTFDEAEKLLELFWRNRDYEPDSLYAAACKRLEYNLEVSSFCNDKLNDIESPETQSIKQMFQQLAFKSILSVLNGLKLIERLYAEDVIMILERHPSIQDVTKTEMQEGQLSSEVTVFLCYQIMKKTLNLYLKGYNIDLEVELTPTDSTCNLAELRSLIRKIHPLSLRLEVLENMFSLLFTRQKDLQPQQNACSNNTASEKNVDVNPKLTAQQYLVSSDQSEESPFEATVEYQTMSTTSDVPPLGQRYDSEAFSDGFLFDETAIGSFLEMLNDSLVELTAEKFAEKDRSTRGDSVKHADLPLNLDQRISHLSQCVKEAIWRLQLMSGFDHQDEIDEIEDASEDEETEAPVDDKEDDMGAQHENQLISRMLSSPDSLVHLCLRKGSTLQAKQVIKMFNLYGTSCAWEIEFAECFSLTLKELKDKSSHPIKEPSQPIRSSQLSTIKSAAAAGLFSSSVRNVVDKLLLHPCITSCKAHEKEKHDPMVFSAVAVCTDLAVSGKLGSTVCKTVIDMADSLMKECEDTSAVLNLASSLSRIKSLVALYGQLESNIIQNEFDADPTSFTDFLCQGYRRMNADSIEQDFQRIAKQQESFRQMSEFITAQEMTSSSLTEDRGSEVGSCRKYMNECLSSFSVEKLVFHSEYAPKRDYLKTLFRHIDTLARLQLHCKSRHRLHGAAKAGHQSSFGNIKAVNPFVVLKDNISDIFGRLLFEWNMSPKRLESVAKQVNISIVSVVARNFGLEIPVKQSKTYTDLATFLITQERITLNSPVDNEASDLSTASESQSEPNDPTVVMESLLEKLIKLISGLPLSYESHIGAKQISNLVSSDQYIEFSKATMMLRTVDLDRLSSEEERLCFMINLYNLMFTHGILFIIGGLMKSFDEQEQTNRHNWTYESVMERPVGRLALHQYLCYQVGQIGVLSAFDLYRYILLGGVATTFYGESLKANHDLFEWTSEYLAHSPNKEDCRSLFLISHGSTGCPPLKILKPATLEDQLKNSTKNFLERTVQVDPSGLKVTLPRLIYWHRGIFLPRQPLTSGLRTASSIDFRDRESTLLQFIGSESNKLRDQLKHVSMENLAIVYNEHNWNLNINHDISVKKKKHSTIKQRSGDFAEKGKFTLSEPMKEYLAEASPVTNALIVVALEQKQLIGQVDRMIIEGKYSAKRMGANHISSLVDFIEKGVINMQELVRKNRALKAYISKGFSLFLRTIRSLRHDEKLINESYVEAFQSVVKNWLCSINPFNPIEAQYTNILPQLIDFFMLYGGFEISGVITALPHVFPVAVKDRLLCECIVEINDRLSDLFEANLSITNGGVQFDIDRINLLAKELKHSILLLYDPFLKCHTALQSICYFDYDDALDILEICAEDCSSEICLVEKLYQEKEKIQWYHKILCIIQQRSQQLDSRICAPISVKTWQDVIELAQMHPDYITVLLISTEAYHLVNYWVLNFSVPHKLSKICLHAKIHDLLNKPLTDYVVLYTELEKLKNKHMTLEICQDMLNNRDVTTRQTLLLIQYMAENLSYLLDQSQYLQLLHRRLSVTAMGNFSESMKLSYRPLVCWPLLILEQLLMNIKMEHAKIVVESFRHNIKDDLLPLLTQIDDIVVTYAKKSLKVPVIEMVSQTEAKSTVTDRRESSKKHTRNESYSKSQLQAHNLSEEEKSTAGSYKGKATQQQVDGASFQAQVKPVERNMWFLDKSVAICMACNVTTFSTFNRRHHCRHCGRIACADCSDHRCSVIGYQGKVRVCQQCFDQVYSPAQNFLEKQKEHLAHLAADSRTASPSSPNVHLGESMTGESVADSSLNVSRKQLDGDWQLTTDSDKNDEIRDEFYFDQAPSASLCISIIDLYSDAQKSGGMLLKFCNDLSKHLNENNRPEASNYHDIDNSMVVEMIEFLLFNAKVKFMKAGDINGVELCDSYIAHVEVLKLLLNSDWQDIPTMQELSHPEIIRRLRDRLVDSERYSLAIDVTGKCGLDASTVWFAWGLSQLKSGDLMCARENFAKCLMPVKTEGSKALQQNAYYLNQIVEIIESSPLLPYMMDEELLAPVLYLPEQGRMSGTGCILDRRRYDEIIYYLTSYGSHAHMVKFYVRNGLNRKAAIYIKDRKCSEEIFIEDLILRSFQNGSFEDLTRELKEIDPSLNVWKDYLTKSCQYFNKKGFFNCLYEMQRFMKDHFRAATTCIRFFLGTSGNPAKSFKEQKNRLLHLETAKMHLEMLLKERAVVRSTFVSHVGSFLGDDKPAILAQEVSTSEVKNHLNTIDLQIKVLTFMNERNKASDVEVDVKLPTLFGNGKERGELVSKLLIVSLKDSFPLVSRIIQDYRLPIAAVFGDCIDKLSELRSYDVIVELMKNIEATGMMSDKGRDELLLHIIRKISEQGGQNVRQANSFIKMIKNDSRKINAFIVCGRLKDAYIESIKGERVKEIERILKEAEKVHQRHIVDICQKYLANYREKQERKERLR